MRISLVVAMDENGLIGADGGMPWHLPNDLRHFKHTTLGKPVLMGRRTHESIGRPLPKRDNIILTRDADYQAPGCRIVPSVAEAVDSVKNQAAELMVIGGAQVYTLALEQAHHLYITRIHEVFEGDTWFPAYDPQDWNQISCERHTADENNPHDHSFIELQREA